MIVIFYDSIVYSLVQVKLSIKFKKIVRSVFNTLFPINRIKTNSAVLGRLNSAIRILVDSCI